MADHDKMSVNFHVTSDTETQFVRFGGYEESENDEWSGEAWACVYIGEQLDVNVGLMVKSKEDAFRLADVLRSAGIYIETQNEMRRARNDT